MSQILIRKKYPDASLHDHTICSWFKITDPQISIRNQGFGSGLDPYSIGPVDPDPYSESGSGSRRAKMTHKSRKKLVKVYVLSVGWPLLWAAGFFCNLDILYGGLGISKLQFLIKTKNFFLSAVLFFKILVIKALDPDWIRIRIGLQPQPLDPDP